MTVTNGGGGSSGAVDVSDRLARILGIAQPPAQWKASSNPGAGANALATRAAQATQANIAQVLVATYFNNSAAARTVTVSLLDGGTTMAAWVLTAAANSGANLVLPGLWLPGTVNTQMQLSVPAGVGTDVVTAFLAGVSQ